MYMYMYLHVAGHTPVKQTLPKNGVILFSPLQKMSALSQLSLYVFTRSDSDQCLFCMTLSDNARTLSPTLDFNE